MSSGGAEGQQHSSCSAVNSGRQHHNSGSEVGSTCGSGCTTVAAVSCSDSSSSSSSGGGLVAAAATGGGTLVTSGASSSSSGSAGSTSTLSRMTAGGGGQQAEDALLVHHSGDHRLPSSSRVMRNMAEKMRRDKLNNYITELAAIVPHISSANKRIDKTSVLRLSANYIRLNRILKDDDDEGEKPSLVNTFDSDTSQKFMDVADGFLLLVTSTGKVVCVTDAIETSFGHSKVDLLGNSIYSIIHPDDVDIFQQQLTPKGSSRRSFYCRMMEKALSRNDPGRYEIIHVVGNLTPIPQGFWNSLTTGHNLVKDEPSSPNTDKGDEDTDSVGDENEAMLNTNREGTHILKSFVRVVKDRPITELSLMESIQDEYITRHQMDGRILYTDHRISFVTGLMPGEVLGSSAFSFMHADDMLWSIVAQKQMFSSSQGQGIVSYRLQCRDGNYVTLRTRGFLEVNKQSGQVDTFVCINTVLSLRESENEIRTQRRKLLPIISCQESENLLGSISSSLPPELFDLLKPLLNHDTVQKMIDSLDTDDLNFETKAMVPLPQSSNNDSDSYECQERWQNDGWEEINPNHPPPKPVLPVGIPQDMTADENRQCYPMNTKKRNQDGKNYFPPSKKVTTLSSHNEPPLSSYSNTESHSQSYGVDGQTYCQQNVSWPQLDGPQTPSDQPVSPQTKRFCPDTNNLRNSLTPKHQNICSISSSLDASSPTSISSYSTVEEDDQNSLCSAQSPSENENPMSAESCINTIFGNPVNSMCSNFCRTTDRNMESNVYTGSSDRNMESNVYTGSSDNCMGNNNFSGKITSKTVRYSQIYDGTNNSKFEMVGITATMGGKPECISPSVCSRQQQFSINRPSSIAQVCSPGGMVCSPGGLVHSPGLSSPTDLQCSVSSDTHPISPTPPPPGFFQSQSSLPDQDCKSPQNSPFQKPQDQIQTSLHTTYQKPRNINQQMMRNNSNSNFFPSDGNGHLLKTQMQQQTQEQHYNLQSSRVGINGERQDFFHHQHTLGNKHSVIDESYTVTEDVQQVSSNVNSCRGPPPPKPPHPLQPPEAPRYNLQQQQQQQQQQQHRGQNL